MIRVPANYLLLIIDPQARMMPAIDGGDAALSRMKFLMESARTLAIPVWSTRQNPEKLGDLEPGLEGDRNFDKFSFSSYPTIAERLQPDTELILVEVETHICVYQTARDFLLAGYSVKVAADAVGARTPDRHDLGLRALSAAGTELLHSEAVVYDWLQSADHPRFRDVLAIVKRY
jgi:nicotinamidase-related amidase